MKTIRTTSPVIIFLMSATTLVMMCLIFPNVEQHVYSSSPSYKETRSKMSLQKKKQILLWNNLPGRMSDTLGTGRDGFFRHGCEFTNCYVTNDRNKAPIHTYDAVVFNMNVLHHFGPVPWTVPNFTRNENQRFVFFSQEPPMYVYISAL